MGKLQKPIMAMPKKSGGNTVCVRQRRTYGLLCIFAISSMTGSCSQLGLLGVLTKKL